MRRINATRAANAGATVAELKALFRWTDDGIPSLYTRCADRVPLAKEAITKLQKKNKIKTSNPTPKKLFNKNNKL